MMVGRKQGKVPLCGFVTFPNEVFPRYSELVSARQNVGIYDHHKVFTVVRTIDAHRLLKDFCE